MLYAAVQLVIWFDIIRSIYALYARNNKLALALLLYIFAQAGASLWVDLTPSVTRSTTPLLKHKKSAA